MPDQDTLIDGSIDFSRGQDAAKTPDHVSGNGYYAGINVSTHKGCLSPRFGWKHKVVSFPEGGVTLPTLQVRPYKSIFEEGKFQAAIPYTLGQEFFHIIIISGVMYLINRDTLETSIITISDGSTLDQFRMRINWESAGRFLVIHDYPAYPVILENGLARRADPAKFEVPISTQGAYNQNRLFVVNGLNEFTAGDPTGNLLTPNAPITFEEVLTPGAFFNQFFQLATGYGNDPITAITFLQMVDDNTKIGTLIVSTKSSIWSYATQNPRAQWQAGVFGTVFADQAGIVGPKAFTHVNSDLFFLSSDGQLRTASMSRTEQGKWSKVPISREVENWLKYYDESLAQYAFMEYFNNTILVSANPFNCVAKSLEGNPVFDVAFGGFVILDTANISTIIAGSAEGSGEAAPAWDGLWTGVRPMAMWQNGGKAYLMSKDFSKVNRLYEIDPKSTSDEINGKERYIESSIYTRQYDFKDQFLDKELQLIDFSVEEVRGNFKLDVSFKPSHSPNYLPWNSFEHAAPYRVCEVKEDCTVKGLKAQSLPPIRLGPPDTSICDELSKIFYEWFRKVQLKIKITGKTWQLRAFKLFAIQRETPPFDSTCNNFPTVEFCEDCNTDWSTTEADLCRPVTT